MGHVTDKETWEGRDNKGGDVWSIACDMGQLGTTVQEAFGAQRLTRRGTGLTIICREAVREIMTREILSRPSVKNSCRFLSQPPCSPGQHSV